RQRRLLRSRRHGGPAGDGSFDLDEPALRLDAGHDGQPHCHRGSRPERAPLEVWRNAVNRLAFLSSQRTSAMIRNLPALLCALLVGCGSKDPVPVPPPPAPAVSVFTAVPAAIAPGRSST